MNLGRHRTGSAGATASRSARRVHLRARRLAAAVAVTGAVLAGSATGSSAATVPNMFWRTCTVLGCSAYAQSNPPYNASVISRCYTKNWLGQVTSWYDKWGRC